MLVVLAQWFVKVLCVYAVLGLVFGACFVVVAVSRLDPLAKDAGVGFRLLILPGVAALWPLFLYRWFRGSALE